MDQFQGSLEGRRFRGGDPACERPGRKIAEEIGAASGGCEVDGDDGFLGAAPGFSGGAAARRGVLALSLAVFRVMKDAVRMAGPGRCGAWMASSAGTAAGPKFLRFRLVERA